MSKILILYTDAGHGHRKVAEAIEAELKSKNIQDLTVEVSDALEKINWLFRYSYPKIYHQLVLWVPWLWKFFYFFTNIPSVYFLIKPIRSLWNQLQSIELRNYLRQEQFDIILFTHFFPAEVCATAKRKGEINSKLVTIVTDVIPHAVWQNSGTDYYWVMAQESLELLVKRGVSTERIYPNGIPISSQFLSVNNRTALQNKFGLKPNRFTILFTSGSFGIGPTEEVIDSLQGLNNDIQIVVVCGNNQHLFRTLNQRRFTFPVILFGFVNNMHEIMSVADLLIAKPGGATTCESLVQKLPMIILAPIPGQESFNAKWLLDHQAAFQVQGLNHIKDLVAQIVKNPNRLELVRQSIEKISKPHATSDLINFILNQLPH